MKRGFYLLFLIFLCNGVFAVEGVSPGSYEVNFEPGLGKSFVFDFVVPGKEDVFVVGDLAKYVMLDKKEIFERGKVVATLNLPDSIEGYGESDIWVVAGDVRGLIRVNIPYPDNFVKSALSIPNFNSGENVSAILRVSNLGNENVIVDSSVDIYLNDEFIDSYNLTKRTINVKEESVFEFILDSEGYLPGEYAGIARINYGETLDVDEDVFRVGEFRVRILGYTQKIKDDIERFEVEVESLWNDDIENVYMEVRAEDGRSFDSPISSLGPWEKKTLAGFFDANGLKGDVKLNVSIHYDGKAISEVVYVEVVKTNWYWSVGIAVGALLLVLLWLKFKR